MISVDSREGSAALAPLLRSRGLPVELTRMTFGDVCFLGIGKDECPVSVGIEVKTIHDVLKCVTDGRFAGHQLPGLVSAYDQAWLLIEGLWRANPQSGVLEYYRNKGRGKWTEATVGTRRFMYRDLWTWLLTVVNKGGVGVIIHPDWGQAATWIHTLYSWWTTKGGWDGHKSHLAINETSRGQFFDRALLVRPTILRMVAKELPGVGYEKSQAVAAHFGNVHRLVNATEKELREVEGIGPGLALKIYQALRGK